MYFQTLLFSFTLTLYLWLWFSVYLPSTGEGWEAYESFLMGETDWGGNGLVLMGRAMLSKSLVQFSIDGWGCVPFLLSDLRPNMVEVMKIMVTFKRSHACTATFSVPDPAAGHHQPMPPAETPGHSQASLGQSLVGSLLLSPGSWYTQGFCVCVRSPSLCFPSLVEVL